MNGPTALRLGIDELNAAYADCIDDDRLEEWPDFFVETVPLPDHRPRKPPGRAASRGHLLRLARHG